LSLDIQAGKVLDIEVGCVTDTGSAPWGLGFRTSSYDPVEIRDGEETSRRQATPSHQEVCWTNRSGRAFVADFSRQSATWLAAYRSAANSDPDRRSIVSASIAATAREFSADDASTPQVNVNAGGHVSWFGQWPIWLTAGSVLGLLATMLGGEQPRRGTKWAWFWVFAIAGVLGAAWYLIREAPWSRRAAALPEPERRATGKGPLTPRGRLGGGKALLGALLVTVVVGFLASLVIAEVTQTDESPAGVRWAVTSDGGDEPLLIEGP
jgi:MFS family permease